MPAQAVACLLRLLLPWSQYTLLYFKTNSASLPLCNTLLAYPSSRCSLMIHSVYCDIILANLHSYAAIQQLYCNTIFFPAKPSCLLQYYFVSCNTIPCLPSAKPAHFKSQYTSNLAIQTLFCNTMGSSPFFHCTKFFIFFFHPVHQIIS